MIETDLSILLAEEKRLRVSIEEDLNLRLRQQEAIAWLGEYALNCKTLDEVFQEAVRVAADTLDMEYGKILERLPDGQSLLLRSGVGWADGLVGHSIISSELNSQAGFTLIHVEPVIVDDLRTETRFSDLQLLSDHQVISGMGVVIPGRDQPFGVLSVHSARQRKFLTHDTRFIKAIASLLASAIQRFSTEEDLRRSRNELSIILEGINEGVTVQDCNGKLVFSNQAAADIMGYESAEDAVNADLSEVYQRFRMLDEHGELFPIEKLPGRQVLQGAPRATAKIRFRVLATGEERWAMVDSSPVIGVNGNVFQTVNIFRDITDLILSEQSQHFLADASEILGSSIDYQTTLANLAKLAVTNLADWCSIVLINEAQEAFQLTVAHKDPAKLSMAESLQKRYPPKFDSHSSVGRVLHTGKAEYYPIITDDLIEAAAIDAEHLAAIRQLGMRSVLVVPLSVHGRILGAISLVWADSGRRYCQRDVDLTHELARRAALAIENARLYHAAQVSNVQLEQRVEQRTHELIATNHRLGHEVEERKKTQLALQKSQVMLHSLFESAPDALILVNQAGKIMQANQQTEIMFGYSRAQLKGSSIDVLLPDNYRQRHAHHRSVYMKDMTTRSMGAGLGLSAVRSDGSEFPVDIMLNPVKLEEGEMIICAIRNITEQKRLQAELTETHRRLFESVDAERLRISQDLHDGPIQELYGLALYFEGLRDKFSQTEELAKFKRMQESLQVVAQTLRSICGELRPPTLTRFGVEKAIRSHLSKLREAHPALTIEARLMSDGQALNERTRLALYRVYQNAISNIIRHAQASHIRLSFVIEDGQLELTIWDNGRGFSVPVKWVDLAREGHFGLVGMAERVEAIGGEFTIESLSGQGTTVRVVVSLEQALMAPTTSLA